MGFFQPVELSFLGIRKDLMRNLVDIFSSQDAGIDLSDSGDNLSLLGLVVEDGNLFAFLILELPSEQRVSGGYGNNFGILISDDVVDVRPGHQHRGIGYLFVALL